MLAKALARITSGEASGLVVYRLDRLVRSVPDLSNLLTGPLKGKAFVSVSEAFDSRTPHGEFTIYILGAVAQLEKRLIGERTKEALRVVRGKGIRLGAVPYGYRAVCRDGLRVFEPDPVEAEWVSRMRTWADNGCTLEAIAATLTDAGVPTRRGGAWRASTIAQVLSR